MQEAAKKAAEKGEKITIAVPHVSSGSYHSAGIIGGVIAGHDNIELVDYFDTKSAVQAVADGEADLGLFVEYPGFDSTARESIEDNDLSVIHTPTTFFADNLSKSGHGYQLHKVSLGEQTVNMTCTQTLIAGRDHTTIDDAFLSGKVQRLHDSIEHNITTDDLDIGYKSEGELIAVLKEAQQTKTQAIAEDKAPAAPETPEEQAEEVLPAKPASMLRS